MSYQKILWGHLLFWLLLSGFLPGCGPTSADVPKPPTAPGNVVAIAGNQTVTLSWDSVLGAARYDLYWSHHEGGSNTGHVIENIHSPKVHTGLVNGARLYYRIVAVSSGGKALSSEVHALPSIGATAPGAPSSVVASGGDGEITLSWGWIEGANYYTVYRGRQSGVSPTSGEANVGAANPLTDTELTNNQAYFYVVTATTDRGEGPPSAQASATPLGSSGPPARPSGLAASAGDEQVTLTWNSVAEATGYTLYYSEISGVTTTSGTALANASAPFEHQGLSNNHTYYYIVTASNAQGESPASAEASATPQATGPGVPTTPTNLVATPSDSQVTLSWDHSANATSHTLYFGLSSGVTPSNGITLAGVSSPYVHSNISNGQTYYYIATASNAQGESTPTAEVDATPGAVHGGISSTLPAGVHAIVIMENLSDGQGLLQVQVLNGGAQGTPINGLTVQVSGAASGGLDAGSQGTYFATTPTALVAGTYTLSISGMVSGTVEAIAHNIPTCSVDQPSAGSHHPVNQDLQLLWTSTFSEKALIKFEDSASTVSYPAVGPPDPGGIIVPGTDLINSGDVEILISAVWKIDVVNANLICFGDASVSIVLDP